MIEVTLTAGKRLSLKVKGHAGSAEIGKDLVCASASILAYTLAQNVKDAGEYCEKTKVKVEEGDAEIVAKPKPEYHKAMTLVYRTIVRGFELLQANFPDKIKVQRGKHK